jgi:transposase InsO family protein
MSKWSEGPQPRWGSKWSEGPQPRWGSKTDSESLLAQLYYDPKTGFISANKLHKKAKEINSKVTLKQVQAWYKTQNDIQEYAAQNKKLPQFKIASNNPNSWQMDLMFVRCTEPSARVEHSRRQAIVKRTPILIAININSRIGYAKLLPNKKAATVQQAIEQFIKQHEVDILTSDNGSEFTNKSTENLLTKSDIEHYNTEPGDHTVLGKIDRFIRTIKMRLTKIAEQAQGSKTSHTKTLTQNLLNEVIANYNNTYHTSLKATPNATKGKVIESEMKHNLETMNEVTDTLKPGDKVRHKLTSKTFDKEGAKYSKTVYEVVGFDGLKMHIKSKNNHVLYKPVNDLKLVQSEITTADATRKDNIHEVKRILDHVKLKNGKFKYLIEWTDGDKTWEPQNNLRLIQKNRRSQLEVNYWTRVS